MRAGVDPITGDHLRPVERFSLFVQGRMRQWRFILLYSGITAVWWLQPAWFGDNHSYTHWQLAASYSALLIESVVGIGMFGWARRDSVVLRKIHALERKAEHQDENDHVLLHEILRLARQNETQLRLLREIKRNGHGSDG